MVHIVPFQDQEEADDMIEYTGIRSSIGIVQSRTATKHSR
jgi:hypothetical protein